MQQMLPHDRPTTGNHRWRFAYFLPWIAFAVLAAVVLQAPGIITKTNTHDLYVAFDGIWRIFAGQQVFVDFHSPIGIAYFVPYMLLRHFEPFSLLTLFHGNLLVASWLLILASLTLPQRLSPGLFFWAAFGVVAVAISPRTADLGIKVFSHLAPYNRWCEAATMLAVPLLLLSRSRPGLATRWNGGTEIADGATLALLALFVFHIKISYFFCVVGLAATGLVYQRLSLRTALLAAGLFAASSLLLELTLQLHRPYLADLNMAVAATLEVYGKVRLQNYKTGPFMVASYLLGAVALISLTARAEARIEIRRRWALLLLVAIGLGLAAITNLQNSPQAEVPMMGAVLLVAIESLRRQGAFVGLRQVPKIACLAVFVLGVAAIPSTEAASVLLHGAQSRTQSVCALPALRGTVGERLLFTRYSLRMPTAAVASCKELVVDLTVFREMSDEELSDEDSRLEAARLTDAFAILKGRPSADRGILALDFANPYPAFTGSRPTHGALLWWDYGRNYSKGSRPDPASLLADVDYVLESKVDPKAAWERHGENARKVYGAEMSRQFKPIEEGRLWRLWGRKLGGGDGRPAVQQPGQQQK